MDIDSMDNTLLADQSTIQLYIDDDSIDQHTERQSTPPAAAQMSSPLTTWKQQKLSPDSIPIIIQPNIRSRSRISTLSPNNNSKLSKTAISQMANAIVDTITSEKQQLQRSSSRNSARSSNVELTPNSSTASIETFRSACDEQPDEMSAQPSQLSLPVVVPRSFDTSHLPPPPPFVRERVAATIGRTFRLKLLADGNLQTTNAAGATYNYAIRSGGGGDADVVGEMRSDGRNTTISANVRCDDLKVVELRK